MYYLPLANEKEQQGYHAIAVKVLDDFLVEFNTRDPSRWAKTVHYPHVRMAGGRIQQWNTPEDYAGDNDPMVMRENCGWAYTTWDWVEVLQADEDKMHTLVQFSRYTDTHERIVRVVSLYIMTKINGKWGIQFRSSYLGVAGKNSAF